MKTAVANLSKWTEKTVALVRRICNRKPGPCVGLAMLFVDPMAKKEEQWNFVIELAGDPNNPMSPEDRESLTKAFEHIMAGVAQLLDGALENDTSEFEARGTFH
jgi:hypothetical protein